MSERTTRSPSTLLLAAGLLSGIGIGFLWGLADLLTRSLPLDPFAVLAAPFYGAAGLLFAAGSALVAFVVVGKERRLPFLLAGTTVAFPVVAALLEVAFRYLPHQLGLQTLGAGVAAFALWLLLTLPLAALFGWFRTPLLIAPSLLAGIVAVALAVAGNPVRRATVDAAGRAEGPNVILLLVDTLRADHLGLYGYPRPTSPNLDRLAVDGVQFTEAYAQCSWTKPSVVSMLASRYPFAFTRNDLYHRVPRSANLLPELFARAGYRTGAIVANPVVSPDFGFDQGFETYDHGYLSLSALRMYRYLVWLDLFTHPRLLLRADYLARSARSWIDEAGDDSPFFLYLHFMDPHEAYDPGAPYDRLFRGDRPLRGEKTLRYPRPEALPFDGVEKNPYGEEGIREIRDRYDGEVRRVDDAIGSIVNHLRRKGLYERTIVAVVADHGEEFLDHGGWGHGQSLYAELTRVPFVLKPEGGRIDAGAVDERRVMLVDVGPTLLALAGIEPAEEMEGRDLFGEGAAPFALGDVTAGETRILSLREGEHHYVRAVRGEERIRQLFRIDEDPGERHDRSDERPDQVDRYAAWIDSLLEVTVPFDTEEAALSEEAIEQLRALGYLQK